MSCVKLNILDEQYKRTEQKVSSDQNELISEFSAWNERKFSVHGNHLTSVQMVTDVNASVVQFIQYAPFGEVIGEHNSAWNSNLIPDYKFNVKELDEENQMYYFEARYNKPPTFISRDPLFEKYFWISPYSSMMNNPLRYVDPTGMAAGDPLETMKVRRMKTSNTFGMVRRYADGTPKAHQGIDYWAPVGTPVKAVKDGKIVDVNPNNGDYGITLTLEFTNDDGNTAWAFYSHLSEVSVKVNDPVTEGDNLGKTGDSGNAKGMGGEDTHLHFEYRTKGKSAGKGLAGRDDPNKIVDTKFEVDPNNPNKVIKVPNTPKEPQTKQAPSNPANKSNTEPN